MSSKSLIFSNQPEKSLAQQILQKNNGKYSIALHRFSTDVYTYKKSDVAVYSHKGTLGLDGYTVEIQRVSSQFQSYHSCRAKGYTSLIFT